MKTRILIPILLLAALAAISCDKEQGAPVIEIVSGDNVVLSASIGTPDTRIHFEKDMGTYTETKWQDGDCIWVRSSTQPYWERGDCFKTSAAQISQDGHKADFTGRTRVDGKLCAIYPYSRVLQGSDNATVQVDVPQSRELRQGDCPEGSLVAGAFWADGKTSFTMQYLLGAIKFSVTGNGEKVSRFVLIDANPNNALWGSLEITPDYDAKQAVVNMQNTSPSRNSVALECDVTLGSSPLAFYFTVPAGSFSKGLVLKAYGQDGKMVASVVTTNPNAVECGKVRVMPTVAMQPAAGGQAFEGSGIEADPYLVATSENLAYLSQMLSSDAWEDYSGKYYRQTEDIDMSGVEFSPIGEKAKPFKGVYNGGGKTIANLSAAGLNSDNPASGVFGYAENALLTGITVKNRINSGSFNRVGGIVGYAKDCNITDSWITSGELKASNNMCGGIVAEMVGGSIMSCGAKGVKITNTKNYAGGIVAYAHDDVVISACCISEGAEVSAPNEVGGIVGKMEGGRMELCSADASKVSAGSEDAGGIGGWVIGSCQVFAPVLSGSEVSANKYAGGIVGLLENSTVENATLLNSAVVKATASGAGGIVGYMKKAAISTIKDCSVKGSSRVEGNQNVGGIAGWLDTGEIVGCTLNDGASVNASGDGVGGIVGRAISKSGTDNTINGCTVINAMVKGAYSVAGIVGYAYPDSNGRLFIINSGILGATVNATSCDTGADPTKGDCMSGGIGGWMRLKDSGSKAYIVNCYAYPKAGGFICDLPMAHPSFGGIAGYASVSSSGAFEILNCVTDVKKSDFMVNGSVIADVSSTAQVGTVFGLLPSSAGVRVSDNCYLDEGELGIGVAGENAVVSGNNPYPASVFDDGATVVDKLNAFVDSYTGLKLLRWSVTEGKALPQE